MYVSLLRNMHVLVNVQIQYFTSYLIDNFRRYLNIIVM